LERTRRHEGAIILGERSPDDGLDVLGGGLALSVGVVARRFAGREIGPRARAWAIALVLIGLAPIGGSIANAFHDWPAFWSAGATVGTPDLLDPARHLAWQVAHGLPEAFFPYPPGTAWLYAPFAALPLGVGFALNGFLMLAAAAGAGVVLARTFGVSDATGALATLAFAPVTASVVLGQNGPLGLLLAALAIAGLATERPILTGLATGLLLYKPTYAAPLLGLLLLRRRWSALAIAIAVGEVWYVVDTAAADGEWGWPAAWIDGIRGYLVADFAGNADKAISIPGLVARLPVPEWLPVVAGALVVVAALPRLLRAPIADAAVGACLVGVAVSPHAWGYDAALAVPALIWLLAGYGPWSAATRRRALVVAYALGPLWLVSRQTVVSAVAFIVLGLLALWLVRRDPAADAGPDAVAVA
jgi:hypothetical protein